MGIEQQGLLWERTGRHLEPLLGKRLSSVIYWCLKPDGMSPKQWAVQTYQSIGGEVEIVCAETVHAWITWGSNPQEWRKTGNAYSVAALGEPAFGVPDRETAIAEGRLEPFDASTLPLWEPLIGTELQRIDVCGPIDQRIPYCIKFCFERGLAYVGTGTGGQETGFWDNDDVLIRSQAEMDEIFERFPMYREELQPLLALTVKGQ